ncbi:MAG: hypothetical protein ACI8PZ_006914 [Myxococcota bacterium]
MAVPEQYRGEDLSHSVLQRRRKDNETRRGAALDRVDDLATTHEALGQNLAAEVGELQRREVELQQHEQTASQTGLIVAITRRLTPWRTAAPRRSFTEALLVQYNNVSTRLREASRFSDEVQLCALEMQQELDRLHKDLADAVHNQSVARSRIQELHATLALLDEDDDLGDAERVRLRDRVTFELRTEMITLQLHTTAAEQCRQHLAPARALRDTVLTLHEQMSTYVIQATHTVDAAGRNLQALGKMADAPAVVAELQESIEELHAAMDATEHYIESSRRFLADVLPELRNRIEAANVEDATFVTTQLARLEGDVVRLEDDTELRAAAEAEVDAHLVGEG